jgi:hypothetical protein
MRTIGTAATVGMALGIAGGVVGFFLVRFLVEPLGILDGPPAGVLLFTLPSFLTAVCASASSSHTFAFAERQHGMMSEMAILQHLS